MKVSELHKSIRAVTVTHNVGAYIVAIFLDVVPGFFLDLETLLKCPLISQL